MIICGSQHLLSLDENILSVCLLDSNFRVLEAASKESFGKKFQTTETFKNGGCDYSALVYATARLSEKMFGKVECMVVDYGMAKTMLLPIHGKGYVGLVVNRSTSTDYIAFKVNETMVPNPDIENYV